VNGKSLGALRQKLRKYIRENLEEEVARLRENPEAEDEEEEEQEDKDQGSDDEDAEVPVADVPVAGFTSS
jgi:translation initiation factor 3 subunit C